MFALVADVESYPQFVPNWHMVRVRNRTETSYHTDQVVRFGPMRHTFTTDTRMVPPHQITVSSKDTPFRFLDLSWAFRPADDGGCWIELEVSFELRSRALQAISSILSRDSVVRMVDAFEHRAQDIYGPPAHASHE
jgi:coenzyme Q-binding protein COQ10